MNKYKSFTAVITLLAFLAVRTPIAYAVENDTPPSDDEIGDYESMEKGEKAPYDGLLFTNEAIIKIITNKHLELDKLKLDKDTEIKKIQLDLDILKKQHDLETKITKDLNDNLLKLKQDRIILFQILNIEHQLNKYIHNIIITGIMEIHIIFRKTNNILILQQKIIIIIK